MTDTVVVLMATYNGEKYLEEQIISIINQKGVNVQIIIRDDNSSDNTVSVIRHLVKNYSNITFISGNNVGVAMNFYKLAQYAAEKEERYYAFADQDDIWDENKLNRAVNFIKHETKPALYFSNLNIIDSQGNKLYSKEKAKNFVINKRCALVQNQALGCTMVFNKKALDVYVKHEPKKIQMHDFWMFILMSFLGNIIYDSESYIGYRQHDNNVVGADYSLLKRWKSRIKYIGKLNQHPREDMAKELLLGYINDLSEEDIMLIEKVAYYRQNIRKRLALLFDRTIRMSDVERDFWYRIRIIAGDI